MERERERNRVIACDKEGESLMEGKREEGT